MTITRILVGLALAVLLAIALYIRSTPAKPDTELTVEKQPMKLFLPKESGSPEKNDIRPFLTLLLYGNSDVYGYRGDRLQEGKVFNVRGNAIRDYLLNLKNSIADSSFIVAIKPSSSATYTLTVDALDLMTISNITRYSLVENSAEEQHIIDSLRKE